MKRDFRKVGDPNAISEALSVITPESSMQLLTTFHVHFMYAITILNLIIVNLLCKMMAIRSRRGTF